MDVFVFGCESVYIDSFVFGCESVYIDDSPILESRSDWCKCLIPLTFDLVSRVVRL